MANSDAPRGLQPLRNVYGDTVQVRVYNADSAANIFRGQLVHLAADGEVEPVTLSGTAIASADVQIIGVAAHMRRTSDVDRTIRIYLATGEEEWLIQSDDNTINTETEYRGLNYKAIGANSGSTVTGDSALELDGSTGGTAFDDAGEARTFRIVNRYKGVDNEVLTGDPTNAQFIVRINRAHLHLANNVGI